MKNNILMFGCIICCFILVMLSYQITAENNPTIKKDVNNLAINFMHPRNKNIYIGWNTIYLGRFFPDMDLSIVLGKNIYNLFYGIVIRSDYNLSYIEIYVNQEFEMTLTEPTDYDGICQEWQVHWCPSGYNEIYILAFDDYNHWYDAVQNLLVI